MPPKQRLNRTLRTMPSFRGKMTWKCPQLTPNIIEVRVPIKSSQYGIKLYFYPAYLTFIFVLKCLDLNLGSTTAYLYCKIGAHKYLDLDLGVDNGLTSNTNITSTCVPYAYLTCHYLGTYPVNFYHEYTTFFYSLVFHAPKPIKLGSKGSSTKLWGSVKHSRKSKNPIKISKFQNFKKNKNIAKLSAIALVMTFSLKIHISNNFGQANISFDFENSNFQNWCQN
jgi:hypothetical protein